MELLTLDLDWVRMGVLRPVLTTQLMPPEQFTVQSWQKGMGEKEKMKSQFPITHLFQG
jgi:hypothetical protein